MPFCAKLVKLWRQVFPVRPIQSLSLEFVGTIEEFNEYFPGYTRMNDLSYTYYRYWYRCMQASSGCMPWRRSYRWAMAFEIRVNEWLAKNPQKQRPGLTGEWAVDIFADHNEAIMERYRDYKAQRRLKLSETVDERKARAREMKRKYEYELVWLLGKEEYDKHNKAIEDKMREKVREELEREMAAAGGRAV